MRKVLLLSMVLLSSGVYAQGIKFGKHYRERVRSTRSAVVSNRPNGEETAPRQRSRGSAMLDEVSEIKGDRCFRFVYAYNKDKERSSETIYMREKSDGKWGDESLYDVGTYTYEYDSQDRVKAKTVVYGRSNEGGFFTSYRIMVEYGDGVTSYTKYEDYGDGEGYQAVEAWGYYDNGQMASHTYYDSYYDSVVKKVDFDTEGNISGMQSETEKLEYRGTVNDSTILRYASEWDDDKGAYVFTEPAMATHYRYDDSGRLLEYSTYALNGHDMFYVDERRYVYSYDSFGRIASVTQYTTGDDNVDAGGDGTVVPVGQPAAVSRAAGEPEWVLSYEETYTYFNDEVYGIGNSWHDVFGFDGPVTGMTARGYDGSTDLRVTRDESGKITDIFYSEESESGWPSEYEFTVDADGHPVRMTTTSTGGAVPGDYSTYVRNYKWSGDKMVRAEYSETYTHDGVPHEESWSEDYSYGTNSVTIATTSGFSSSKTYMEQKGNRYYAWFEDEYDGLRNGRWTNIREVQTEDVRFVRPNVMKDYAGFTPDSTIVVSVAGRVVCLNEAEYTIDGGPGFNYGIDDKALYCNVGADSYFSVSHDGGNTVCRDMNGRTVYILQGDRLIKEYIYFDTLSDGSPAEPTESAQRTVAVALPSGSEGQTAYEEITYHYADNGLPTGRTIVAVDENGERTEEISIEYKYDPASGITAPEISATSGAMLNGRTLGLADGAVFSVYDMQGRLLAANTASYTFTEGGVYVVTVNGSSFKLSVK